MKVTMQTIWKHNKTYCNLWQSFLLGGANVESEQESIAELLNLCNLKNIVKQYISFKNSDKRTCIDLIMTNCPRSFQNRNTLEEEFPDFHKLTFTALKKHFPKRKPKVFIQWQYKNLRNHCFRIEFENALLKCDFNDIDYDNFIKTFLTVLDKLAPIKKNYLRANHANFMTKQLRKAIMKRSQLRRNDFLKDRNDASQSANWKQRKFCVTFLRKLLTDNKDFGNQLNHSSLIK